MLAIEFLNTLIDIYIWIIIIGAVASWLFAFGIINSNNRFLGQIYLTLLQLTEPLYRPIRRVLPDLGGLDLSPLIVLLALIFLQNILRSFIYG